MNIYEIQCKSYVTLDDNNKWATEVHYDLTRTYNGGTPEIIMYCKYENPVFCVFCDMDIRKDETDKYNFIYNILEAYGGYGISMGNICLIPGHSEVGKLVLNEIKDRFIKMEKEGV